MLEKRKNVRKIRNIIIVLIAIIAMLTIAINSIAVTEVKTIGVEPFVQVQSSLDLEQGTITPVYKPKWEKVGSTIDIANKKLTVTVKGLAYENNTSTGVDESTGVIINYASDVTSTLAKEDIKVFVDGVEVTSTTNPNVKVNPGSESTSATTSKKEITHTIELTNLEEAVRNSGIPYKLWSGNITIRIAGRGEAETTYTENVLKDSYGNQNMMALDTTGTWIDVKYGDTETDHNTDGTMFADFIRPEFTYKYAGTSRDNPVPSNPEINYGDKTVAVVFDVTDKYFSSTELVTNATVTNSIIVKMSDYTDEEVNSKIEKSIEKVEDVYDTNGTTKIGERYKLIIRNLQQDPKDGFKFSGYMSVTFPGNIAEDKSGNKNVATTIAIGLDENDGNPNNPEDVEGDGVIVDVVDPIWSHENLVVGQDASGRTSATVDLMAIDKFFKKTTLTKEQIKVLVAGEDISTKAPELVKTLTGPTSITNGDKYTFTLSNFEETYEAFLAARAKYEAEEAGGRVYREFSGPTSLIIPKETAEDNYANKNQDDYIIDLGSIDTLKPEVVKVSSEIVENATNIENSKLIVTFDITDKYLDTSAITESNTSKIHVLVNGTEATSVTKTITNIQELKATINNVEDQLVGYRYTLEVSNFENSTEKTSVVEDNFTNWSGDVSIKVDAETAKDKTGLYNADTTMASDFVDFIKPDVTYKYTESSQATAGDIDYQGKTFKMVFEFTDKYFANSTLTSNDLTILIDGEEPDWREEGETVGVTKSLTSTDITYGKRYTLTLSNLEQLEKLAGQEYVDYSGVITVAIPAGELNEDGTLKKGGIDNNGNLNDGVTITSGIEIEGDVQLTGTSDVIDVVDPIWEKVSASASAIDPANTATSTASITIKGTDKYYASSNLTDKIKVLAHQVGSDPGVLTDVTDSVNVSISDASDVDSATGVRIGDEYTITLKGFAQNINQLKIEIQEDAMLDQSGNGNKPTQLIVYNVLEVTNSETDATSGFLDGNDETNIARQDIEKVIITNSISGASGADVKKAWDVSAAGDNSIKAWTTQTEAPYTVYIGSEHEIFANQDSSYLFSYIGYGDDCESTVPLEGLGYLNVASVKLMNNMFQYFGHKKMTTFSLGDKFYTSNVTNMSSMFSNTGYVAMETLNLGTNFNTSNVQYMNYMFEYCGYTKLNKLDLSLETTTANTTQFNTSNVQEMKEMFSYCGYTAMQTLNLGNNFTASSATNIEKMFQYCGYTAMQSLSLGDNFNANKATNMDYLFQYCGYTAMQTLDLGDNFNPASATSIKSMFLYTGHDTMHTLDLGDNFNTSNVQYMQNMFEYCGYKALQSLDLSSETGSTNTTQFNTSKVTDMSYMFNQMGHDALQTLNLGTNFDTKLVTNFRYMFSNTGYSELLSLDLGDKFDTRSGQQMGYMFEHLGFTKMTELDLGENFNTSNVYDMEYMFQECGATALLYLDLGNLFDTTNVKTMVGMFDGCGKTSMKTLDLGPAFTKIPDKLFDGSGNPTEDSAHTNFINNCGKSEECIIYAPESIYKNKNAFKLNTLDTANSISYTRGTINPIYKPEWTKVSSEYDNAITPTKILINIKGTAVENLELYKDALDNVKSKVDYSSDVTSALTADDITVYINGVEATYITKSLPAANPTTGEEVTQTLTLSGFEEEARRTGIPFKEWSGNISIRIGGRGEATSTYTAKTLTDVYGNQSMMATDETGTWIDVTYKDTDTDRNANGTMFLDAIKPEITYQYSNTLIGSGDGGDRKVVVVFDVVDKYYKESTINKDDITITIIDEDEVVDPTKITKTLELKTIDEDEIISGLTYKTDGSIEYNGKKIGERYELVVEGLDEGAGFAYSGPMSIGFPGDKIIDYSGNKNRATTITIGIDEIDGNPGTNTDKETGSAVVVDVVDPVWKIVNSSLDTGLITLRAQDKYFKESTLEEDDITVYANEVASTTIEKDLDFSRYIYIEEDENGNEVITEVDNIESANGVEYTLQLSNITLDNAPHVEFTPVEPIVGGTAQYRQENGGAIKLKIEPGTAKDKSNNGNKETTLSVGNIDATNPEVYDVQKIQNPGDGTVTFIFNVTDRNYYPLDFVEENEITTWIDGALVDTINIKSLTKIEIKASVDNTIKVLGHQYTLVLENFVETHTDFVSTGRKFKENSGTLQVKIQANASRDYNGNTLNPDTTTLTDFVDFITPELKYKYSVSAQGNPGDINYEGKTFTIVFEELDKYFKESTLETELINATTEEEKQTVIERYLTILIDGEQPDWSKVDKDLTVSDVKETFTKTVDGQFVNNEYVIGKQYKLVLSKLEQLQIQSGDEYLDYSGIITVAIKEDIAKDTKGNGNNSKTITSGLDILGDVEESGIGQIVDVVDPLWEKVSSSANAIDPANPESSTATITIKGTDKYYASSNLSDKIKVLVHDNGEQAGIYTDVTGSVDVTVSEATKVYKNGTTDKQIGDQYTITITGFEQDINQLRIEILEDAMLDQSGNGNKTTQLVLYNVLKLANTETEVTSTFLGESVETTIYPEGVSSITPIARQDIQQIIFVESTVGSTADGVKRVWDVSAAGDKTIKAWTSQETAPYTVYIGSDWEIFANQDSSLLFSNIGFAENCTEKETIKYLNLLNTKSVANMSYMFSNCGLNAIESLNLGTEFDTTFVTNMSYMFSNTGYNAMESLDLSQCNFDTQNVTDMKYMFNRCGYTAMDTLKLGSKFDTGLVIDMSYMFSECGYTLMDELNLGGSFNTGNVTNMDYMFHKCGYTAMDTFGLGGSFDTKNVLTMNYMFAYTGYTLMPELDLGSKFDTGLVTSMTGMFEGTGHEAMQTLKLGSNFDTKNVTNMDYMFKEIGYKALTSLDLGDKFDTSKVTDMREMFSNAGYTAMTTLDLGEKFNTSKVTDMYRMFKGCGNKVMTSLDLGNLFYTTSATNMYEMFSYCGTTLMTSLDLGPAFTKIPDGTITDLDEEGETITYKAYDGFLTSTGKSGCIIYVPEAIYSSRTALKLNTTSEVSINYTTIGTINPIYRPQWTKTGTTMNTTDKTVTITLKGSAVASKVLDTDESGNVKAKVDYASDVTSALDAEDIQVFINGVEVTSTTRPTRVVNEGTESTNASSKKDITHTFVLSQLEEASRRAGIPFKELSGNISIKIAKGTLIDKYGSFIGADVDLNPIPVIAVSYDDNNNIVGNQNLAAIDNADGDWIDIIFGDEQKDRNTAIDDNVATEEITATTPVYMFADFVQPEFTYKYSETVIGNGNNGDTKKVTVAFDVTDKYFNETTLNADDITISLIDTIPAITIDPTKIQKSLTKTHDMVMKADGTVEYRQIPADEPDYELVLSTGEIKVGEKYELLIAGLEQLDENGYSNGYTYSGPMSIAFPAGVITDLSKNANSSTTITIGVDETDGNEEAGDAGTQQIVDVVDPIIQYFSSSINREDNTATLVIKAIDKYINSETLVGAEDDVKVRIEYIDPDGNIRTTENTSILKQITKIDVDSEFMIFEIKLSNFTIYEGKTKVIIPPDVIKDSSGNGNRSTIIEIDKENDDSAFEEGIVDFTKPTWEYVTSSIQRLRRGEAGDTVTLEIKGTDIYFDNKYVNDEDYELDLSTVKVYVNNELNTDIDVNFATNADGLIKKEYIEEPRELAEGYIRLLKGVKYTLILSNFGTNEGTVKIEIPADTIKDTSLNGNELTQINVGNIQAVEWDVEDIDPTDEDNYPRYKGFRNSIVDYVKPVITYVGEELNPTDETVDIIFTATDTNFLRSNIGYEDLKIYIDEMQVYGAGVNDSAKITVGLESESLPVEEGNGLKYTLKLSLLELNTLLQGDIFERHSGLIKVEIAQNQVEDTSGNKNNTQTMFTTNIVDFVNPNIYYQDKYLNWEDSYALITLRATDRFYDTDTELQLSDLKLYEQKVKADGTKEYIDITNRFADKMTITKSEALVVDGNIVGYDYTIKLEDFDEEFKMKISITAGAKDEDGNVLNGIADTFGNLNDATDILVDLDNRRPKWKYVSTDNSSFESAGKISFTVKGVDKYLDLTKSELEVADIKVLKDGVDITNPDNITISYLGTNTTEEFGQDIYKKYKIDVTGLLEMGTYSLVFAQDTLVDEFDNKSAATTISFSNSVISYDADNHNTNNFKNITYFVTPDLENIHNSFAHELMSVNTTGTNYETSTYRPSSLAELYNNGSNPLFAEPMYDPVIRGYEVIYDYAPKAFAGWAEADEEGNLIDGGQVYGLYDEIPNTVTYLKAVWQEATIVFVSSTEGKDNDTYFDGKTPDRPVKTLEKAYELIDSNGTAESNIIIIMDEVEFNNTDKLTGNATITSLYAGVDYRKDGAELKVSSDMSVNGDIIFDNIELYTSSIDNNLILNYSGDITIGRGTTTTTTSYTFGEIVGGDSGTEISSGEKGTLTIRVEAGRFNNIIAGSKLSSTATNTKSVTHNVVIGNMRDSAIGRNDKLTITGYVAIGEKDKSTQSTERANNTILANITLYSGTITFTDIAVYSRSINGETDGIVNFEMFGGNVTGDIYGGARVATLYESDIFNIMKFYGGSLSGNIFGQGLNTTFTGSTSINLLGKFNMTGNVYGGSKTSSVEASVGKGDSFITINSASTTINGSVYGGGFGTTEGTAYITGGTNITLNAGTVKNNIYGSGYNLGNTADINIDIENGVVQGNIFGGAYRNQTRMASNITVLGGTVKGNIYGGNDNTATELSGDAFYQSAKIIIGDTNETKQPTVEGIIFGGGRYDKMDKTEIQLLENDHITSVYGGSDAEATTITADIYLNGMTVNEIYGGGKTAGTVSIANIYLQSGTATDVYGGGFGVGGTNSNITLEGNATVGCIFGGSNTGGKVTTTSINLKSGTVTDVFGGGNSAEVGTANVTLDGITIESIHGGSKDAGLTNITNVTLNSGTVTNVFGGGLDVGANTTNIKQQGANVTNIYGGNDSLGTESALGGDTGTSNIDILDSTVVNVYGGNYLKGTTRKTNINIHGNAIINGDIFGGGYKSAIGKEGETGSTTINIAGGQISGDINGGSEESIVYGNTNINIGKDATDTVKSGLTAGNIKIVGIIYGAGSTLTPDEVTVVGNTNITMDNSTTSPITYFEGDGVTEKSIYGSGKGNGTYSNGATKDRSTIHIKDFGTSATPYIFKSIEDTGNLYIGNSVLELTGALDNTINATEAGRYYTLNTIVNSLTIYDNTTLYTERGFNKVGGLYSYVNKTSTRATVEIVDGVATKNVDNRLYTLEGVNLIFAKKEVTLSNKASLERDDWGEVTGMSYFGTYINTSNGKEYDLDLFKAGTYVEGQYNSTHNIERDGFYTTIVDETSGNEVEQLITTIDYTNYCDWIINAPTLDYEVDLVASTYGKLSVAELLLNYKYESNYTYAGDTVYTLNDVSTNTLKQGINIINKDSIPVVSTNVAKANTDFGLTMETTSSGWKEQALSNIYSASDNPFDGDTEYISDSSTTPGKIKFKVHNSLNITEEKDLGFVTIFMTGQQPLNAAGTEAYTFNVVIAVNLQTVVDELQNAYVPTFTDRVETELSYTTDSRVDLSYLLYNNMETTPYETDDYRVISTTVQLPAKTKLTLKDYRQDKVYYYHISTDTAYESAETVDGVTRYIYKLSNFAEMGSIDAQFENITSYYNETGKYVLEDYDLSIDFIDSGIDANKLAQETYLELKDSSGTAKYSNGNNSIKFNLYTGMNAEATETISNKGNSYSVVDSIEIPITIKASLLEQEGVLDTKYYDQTAGIAVQIVDGFGVRLKSPELQNFKIIDTKSGKEYSADVNGTIRIPTIEGLGSKNGDYILSITQANVPAGTYIAEVSLYTADDGKYYGTVPLIKETFNVTFIQKLAGKVGVQADDASRIINKSTGVNLMDNSEKAVDMTVKIAQPTNYTNIRVQLYKRIPTYTNLNDETTYTGTSYELVDISQYLQGTWTKPEASGLISAPEGKEYMISPMKTYETPVDVETIEFEKALTDSISTGEYKLVFKAYSTNTLVQEVRKTFIVTP